MFFTFTKRGNSKKEFFCFLKKKSLELRKKGNCRVMVQLIKQLPNMANRPKNQGVVYR